MEVWQLPFACRRIGPPVWQADHVARFLAAHPHPLSGPYIDNGRAVVEEARSHTRARDLLAAEVTCLSLGKHLSASICCGYNIYEGLELLGLRDEGLRVFLAHYYAKHFQYRL